MSKLNKALMATTAIAFAAGLAMPAAAKKKDPSKAPKVVSSGKKMKLKLYGQITRTASFTDNGAGTGFTNAENGHTSTRMGVKASGKINNDLKLKLRYEWNMRSAHENRQLLNVEDDNDNDFDIRWADISFHHKRFGTLWFGRGDGPGNSSSQQDLSGTSTGARGGSEQWDFQNARFVESRSSNNGGGARATTRVGRVFTNMDATSRSNRIRYDSPSIYGFQFRAGIVEQDGWEFALWYKGKVAGMKIRGAINHSKNKQAIFPGDTRTGATGTDTEISLVNGSISVQTPWGIGVSGAGGTHNRFMTHARNNTSVPKNPHFWWAAIWYRAKFFELGETRFKYGYNQTENNQADGDIGRVHGFTIVQQIKSTGTDMYVGYRHASVDRDLAGGTPGQEVDMNDMNIWVLGFRARF